MPNAPEPPDRLALLDHLIHLHDELLASLAAGEAPELDDFDAARDAAFDALQALPPADGARAEAVRPRLEALAERTAQVIAALGALRDASGERLAALEMGRRGLRGYQSALSGARRRGARLGEG